MSFFEDMVDGLIEIGGSIAAFLPRLLGAILILLVGLWIARIIRRWIKKLLDRPSVDKVLDRAGIGPVLEEAGYSGATFIAYLVYIIIALTILVLAADVLDVQVIADLLAGLVAFLPKVLAAIFILVVAAAFGGFVADFVRPWADNREVPWVAVAARWAFIIFGIATALNILEIGTVTNRMIEFGLGAVAVAFAIAFGIGGIDTAKKWWEAKLAPKSQ